MLSVVEPLFHSVKAKAQHVAAPKQENTNFNKSFIHVWKKQPHDDGHTQGIDDGATMCTVAQLATSSAGNNQFTWV